MNTLRRFVQKHVSRPVIGASLILSLIALVVCAKSLVALDANVLSEQDAEATPLIALHHNRPKPLPKFTLPDHTVRGGDDGARVSDLQKFLSAKGLLSSSTPPNGHFGPSTENALKAYQKEKHLDETGTLGPITRDTIQKEFAQ